MKTGETETTWVDSLQAAWPGVQVLYGDTEEAICLHALFYTVWRKYGVLPERYNWALKQPDISFYPLRPELVESTYLLYRATKNPFYLHVGRDILRSLNSHTKTKCGYATVHDVNTMELEDRMESFFLSETCKYLFLLFDRDNHINRHQVDYVFTTEGHVLPILAKFHRSSRRFTEAGHDDVVVHAAPGNITEANCDAISPERRYALPIKGEYLRQLEVAVGLIED